jgi:hypothetical protein
MSLVTVLVVSGADARAGAGEPWPAALRRVDAALAAGDIPSATRAARDAYVGALATRKWEPLLAVGDAYVRVGKAGTVPAAKGHARQAYLRALFRARDAGSVDGILRTADAFTALGDREVVQQCLAAAARLAARSGDQRAIARVREFTERVNEHSLAAGEPAIEPF